MEDERDPHKAERLRLCKMGLAYALSAVALSIGDILLLPDWRWSLQIIIWCQLGAAWHCMWRVEKLFRPGED